jgi:two-component system OmpR family response regulator
MSLARCPKEWEATRVNVFLLEDDSKTLSLLEEGLHSAGHRVQICFNGREALEVLLKKQFDFMILDINVPEMDGLNILRKVREAKIQTPAIFLSAKHTVTEKIEGLVAGSDDYITKPFLLQEVLVRMEVILRRSQQKTESLETLSYHDLSVNLVDRQVYRGDGQKIRLQGREFKLVEFFLKNPEKILTKEMILREVLEYQFSPQTNVVDVFVHRLRSKIDKDFELKLIHTIRGVGYVLKAD